MRVFHRFWTARIPCEKHFFGYDCSHLCIAGFTSSSFPKCLPPIASLSHHEYMVCWANTDIQNSGHHLHSNNSVFLHKRFRCSNVFVCHYALCLVRRRACSTEVTPLLNFLVHSYICCRDTWTTVLCFHPPLIFNWFKTSTTTEIHHRSLLSCNACWQWGNHLCTDAAPFFCVEATCCHLLVIL